MTEKLSTLSERWGPTRLLQPVGISEIHGEYKGFKYKDATSGFLILRLSNRIALCGFILFCI